MNKLLFKLIISHARLLEWEEIFSKFNLLCKISREALQDCSFPLTVEYISIKENTYLHSLHNIRIPTNLWFNNTYRKIGECILFNDHTFMITMRRFNEHDEQPIMSICGTVNKCAGASIEKYLANIEFRSISSSPNRTALEIYFKPKNIT
jgi:hypothetical protein